MTERSCTVGRGRPAARLAPFRRALPALVTFGWLAIGGAVEAVARGRVALPDGAVAFIDDRQKIFLEAIPAQGEGWLSFARRWCGSDDVVTTLIEGNGGRREMLRGVRYRIPYSLLRSELQQQVARRLFEDDRAVTGGWRHRVGDGAGTTRESLWRIAEWFTGRGDNYRAVREANGLIDDHLEPGQSILVPASLLSPAFRGLLPADSPYHLEYGIDEIGEFAIYRLKPGEALYSSVVIRFTGRLWADDVNRLAAEIAERSGIDEVTDIPVGYAVKIPFDQLMPEFLPAGHPSRQAWEEGLAASGQFRNTVRASRLQGVTVILDAGHGGQDVGASASGVWESLYVYDITVRAARLFEQSTGARVFLTTRDGAEHRPLDRDRLPYSRGHAVLTDPPYPIADSRTGVNLRWYLANSLFRRAVREGSDPERVVFLSIHADSLHPSLRGAMAYIPGAAYRRSAYAKSGAVYASRREFKEQPEVSFSKREMTKSEGLSRELARSVIDAFAGTGLTLHPDRPIRDKIIRDRRTWIPAVLRYNLVPAVMLLEVCNLMNDRDRELLQTRDYRQRVAEAIVEGVLRYYGDGEAEASRSSAGGP